MLHKYSFQFRPSEGEQIHFKCFAKAIPIGDTFVGDGKNSITNSAIISLEKTTESCMPGVESIHFSGVRKIFIKTFWCSIAK